LAKAGNFLTTNFWLVKDSIAKHTYPGELWILAEVRESFQLRIEAALLSSPLHILQLSARTTAPLVFLGCSARTQIHIYEKDWSRKL